MSYARPSLQTLIQQAIGDISARSRGSAFIRRSFERVLAYVVAGLTHGTHGHLEWLYKQMSPLTCELEMLLVWGALLRVPRRQPSRATRSATFTGTNTTVLPAGRALLAADGSGWTVTLGGAVAGGTVTVTVEADEPGSAGNLEAGAPLTLVVPIVGIDSAGAVVALPAGTDGADIESVESYRARIVDNFRRPPSGGGPGDYEKWALEVPGVTRAWEFGNRMGVGTVSLAFVRDGDADPEAYDPDDIIPSSPEVADVQDYLDARRPLDMRALYVQAPVSVPVNMTIALRPNTEAVRTAVRAQLLELFRSEVDLETPLAESVVSEAISTASGETAHEITSISSLDPGDWGLLTLGTVNFTTL